MKSIRDKAGRLSMLTGFALVLFFTNLLSAQTTYYVDATGGNDNNNGTATDAAWQSLAMVSDMCSSFQPGDIISFKRGEIWHGERLAATNHASGTAGHSIIYNTYGVGAKPIFDLIIDQSPTWTDEGNHIWTAIIGTGARFFRNNTEMLRDPLPNSIPLGTQGTEYYTELVNGGNNLKLYVYSLTNPLDDTFQWTAFSTALSFRNADYIEIQDLDFRGGSSASIRLKDNTHWLIDQCHIGFNGGYGLVADYSSDIRIVNSIFDSNFTVDQSSLESGPSGIDRTGCSDGLFIGKASQDFEISYCYFKNWSHASFGSNTDDVDNTINYIKFHHNELTAPDILYGGRIGYSGYSEDGEYYDNHIHHIAVANQLGGSRNHFHHNIIDRVLDSPLKDDHIGIGIWLENYNIQIKDNIIENNLIANTDSKGFEIYSINFDKPGEVSGNIFRNNILFNCGLTENNMAIQFHKDQADESIYDNLVLNNLIFNSQTTQTCLYQFNGVLSDVAAFNSQDVDIQDNIGADPLFVDVLNEDYHLTSNSPAIDAGITPLATMDYEDNTIPAGNDPDIGIYEYQTALPVILVQSFAARQEHHNIKLTWSTSIEWQNDCFTISKSPDLKHWQKLVEIKPNNRHFYSVLDTNPFWGTSYYQLTQKDLDGQTIVLGTISISSRPESKPKISPNPTADKIFFQNHYHQAKYQIFSKTGKLIKSGIITRNEIDLSDLPSGIFLVRFIGTSTSTGSYFRVIKT